MDGTGDGTWNRLDLPPAQACPLWHGDRVLFLSDHTGLASVWSCTVDGQDLRQHSRHATLGVVGAGTGELSFGEQGNLTLIRQAQCGGEACSAGADNEYIVSVGSHGESCCEEPGWVGYAVASIAVNSALAK